MAADDNGAWETNQDRDHNEANEVTEIASSSTHVGHDAAGNMTSAPKPTDLASAYDLTYDAWNRLVDVDDGATDVARYEYLCLSQLETYDFSFQFSQSISALAA